MREQLHSANTENIVNHDVDKVDKLQQEFNELKQILYTCCRILQTIKMLISITVLSLKTENLTITTGVQNKKGHKTNNKRKECRKKLAKKLIETQREKHEKFIKNFLNQQLSDSLLALFLKVTLVTDANYISRALDANSC